MGSDPDTQARIMCESTLALVPAHVTAQNFQHARPTQIYVATNNLKAGGLEVAQVVVGSDELLVCPNGYKVFIKLEATVPA